MSKIKYTNDIVSKAIEMRMDGEAIPDIVKAIGMKKPSLQKLFRERGIILTPEQKKAALARRWLNHEPIVDGMKRCSKCKENKPVDDFHKNEKRLTGLVSSCKKCYQDFYEENSEEIKARNSNYRLKNPEKKKETDENYYKENQEYFIEKATKWNKNNPEKVKAIHREYDKRNQPTKNSRTAFYRAQKIQATPKWLSDHQKEEIKRIYINCPKGFHVDHIVPLNGEEVRGLHVPWNLQYLTIDENLRKSNKL